MSIQRKKCKCSPDCNMWPTLGFAGYFEGHAPAEVKEAKKNRKERRIAVKNVVPNLRLVANTDENKELAKDYGELDKWFKERMERCEVKCENCGAQSYWLENNKDGKGKVRWKSCQAHLLPKRHFKSLQTHPLNGMVMGSGFSGLCHCHDFYDSTWEKAAKMDIWPEVVRRFIIMYPLITAEEQRFIPPQLLQEINQI